MGGGGGAMLPSPQPRAARRGGGRERQPRCTGSVGSYPLLTLTLLLPQSIARGVQVGHATAYPEVPKYRVGLAADQARRPVLRTESSEPFADFVNLWPLIGQITRGDQRSDASLKLRVAHCHFFAAASIRPMMMASMFRSDRIACWLNFSASSRRSSSVRRSLT